jgi:hypothetical protein
MSEDRITELSADDLTWLRRAEEHVLKMLRAKYQVGGFTRSEDDLRELQRLIDDRVVTAADVLGTQCIGVVLGNVFVAQLAMHWKRVANSFGDMISLHDEVSGLTYYPLTMVSQRLEDGRSVDLVGLYRDLAATVRSNR